MRLIDADALKELFSEVIGHIAKKPEMNGNLEHMIRASAMVIQMIDDAPTVHPDTTTHDSIPAETGKNDGDGTSGDCISRTQAIDALHCRFADGFEEDRWWNSTHVIATLKGLPAVQSEQVAMIKEIRKWINSKNRGNADYFIVDKIEEIINKYE